MRPGEGTKPMIAKEVTDLPEPDSPTIPNFSPFLSWKLRLSTATTGFVSVVNWTCRWRTSRTGSDIYL